MREHGPQGQAQFAEWKSEGTGDKAQKLEGVI